jgi:HlyD family secretion protein
MMKKKIIPVAVLTLILVIVPFGVTACEGLGGVGGTVSQQQVKVTRGDLAIDVTGNGKIQTSREARLMFGSGGKIEKILVEEGDEVKAGDELARLDKSTLELAYTQAQLAVTQAEVALTQAELAQYTAEYNLKNTRDSEEALELALLNAQIALDTAQNALAAGISAIDFSAIQAELNKARAWYEYVQKAMENPDNNTEDWDLALVRAQEGLEVAQANYDNMLAGYDSQQTRLLKKQVEAAELGVAQAQKNIDELTETINLQELQITAAERSVAQAKQAVELAVFSLNDAQRQLDEATIYAPFDGVIALVTAEEGDIVPTPSMAPQTIIQMIDSRYLELVIEVDEIDIPLVTLNQEADINVDALPDAAYKGKVVAIYPQPVEVGGVVLYKVEVGLDIPERSGIMIGMTASADIVVEEHNNVLTVPTRAVVTNDQGQTIVKVMVGKEIEERIVTTGLDDGWTTEITGGLAEGETVVYEVKVKSNSMSMF